MTPVQRLATLAAQLGPDEQRVLVLVAERLQLGKRLYGPLRADNDGRDFRQEALEECADGLVYAACALMRENGR